MASNFNPLSLVSSGIGGAFQYAGAKQQADAAKQAAQLQAQSAQAALDFTKQKQAEQQAAFQPYQNLGAQAVSELPSMVRPMPTQGPGQPYTTQPGATGYGPSSAQMPTSLSGMSQPLLRSGGSTPMPNHGQVTTGGPQQQQMVLLQAPDGTQKSVPASQAQFYISRGAKQIG